MFNILSEILDLIRDLLPDKSQSNKVWISRIVILLFAFIGAFYIFYFTLKDTELGKRVGFTTTNVIVQLPTWAEFSIAQRNNLSNLSEFRINSNRLVNNAFLISLYARQANDFVTEQPETNTDFLIAGWAVPVEAFSNITDTQIALNTNKEIIFNNTWEIQKNCYSQVIPESFKVVLQNIYSVEKTALHSTHYGICKMYDRSQKITTGLTLSFFRARDLLETNIIEYKQRELTIDISQRLSRFTIPYQGKK